MAELRYFSHKDLDGVMSAYGMIAGTKGQYPDAEVNYSFESTGSFGSIDPAIMTWLATNPEAKFIGITDLTPSREVLLALQEYANTHACKIEIIDHHASTAYLSADFDFITNYNEHADGRQTSATSMVAELHPVPNQAALVIEAVRELDTWDWQNAPESAFTAELAQKLGVALQLLGREGMMAMIPEFNLRAKNGAQPSTRDIFGEMLNRIIENQLNDVIHYLEAKKHRADFMDITVKGTSYHVAYVNASRNLSEVGNMLAELPEADFGMVINGQRISLRSSENAPVDLTVIAQAFNGGGHKHAAGGNIVLDYATIVQNSVNED